MELNLQVQIMAQEFKDFKEKVEDGMARIETLIRDHTSEEREVWKKWERLLSNKADKWVERAIIVALTGIVGAAAWLVWSKVNNLV